MMSDRKYAMYKDYPELDIVGMNQVTFMPWLGYWNRVAYSSVYVDMLDTQYEQHDYYNRSMFKGSWMTLPVFGNYKCKFAEVTFDIRVLPKMVKRISQACAKAPYKSRIEPLLDFITDWDTNHLLLFNVALRDILADIIGLSMNHVIPAIMGEGATTEARLWATLKETVPNMTLYLSGGKGAEYLHKEPPVMMLYQQMEAKYQGISIIDAIVNEPNPISVVLNSGNWVSQEELNEANKSNR